MRVEYLYGEIEGGSSGAIEETLDRKFLDRVRKGHYHTDSVRMLGILFARPESDLAKSEIIPNIEYFHHLSGEHIDFFCVGYSLSAISQTMEAPPSWKFSLKAFLEVRNEFENRTNIRLSGGTDLVLTNAVFNAASRRFSLDFRSTIYCQLDQMKKDGAFETVEIFFKRIVDYAKSSSGDDPTWGYSDYEGLKFGGSALKRLILSLLPKALAADYEKAKHFVVVDATYGKTPHQDNLT